MNKYDFKFRIIKFNGDVVEDTIKAIHQKDARDKLKRKFLGCNIVDCGPAPNKENLYTRIATSRW